MERFGRILYAGAVLGVAVSLVIAFLHVAGWRGFTQTGTDAGYIEIGNDIQATVDREHGVICYARRAALSCVPLIIQE